MGNHEHCIDCGESDNHYYTVCKAKKKGVIVYCIMEDQPHYQDGLMNIYSTKEKAEECLKTYRKSPYYYIKEVEVE